MHVFRLEKNEKDFYWKDMLTLDPVTDYFFGNPEEFKWALIDFPVKFIE